MADMTEQLQRDGAVVLTKEEFQALMPGNKVKSWEDYILPGGVILGGALLLWMIAKGGDGPLFGSGGLFGGGSGTKNISPLPAGYDGTGGKLFYRISGEGQLTADDSKVDDIDTVIAKVKVINGTLVLVVPGTTRQGNYDQILAKIIASGIHYVNM